MLSITIFPAIFLQLCKTTTTTAKTKIKQEQKNTLMFLSCFFFFVVVVHIFLFFSQSSQIPSWGLPKHPNVLILFFFSLSLLSLFFFFSVKVLRSHREDYQVVSIQITLKNPMDRVHCQFPWRHDGGKKGTPKLRIKISCQLKRTITVVSLWDNASRQTLEMSQPHSPMECFESAPVRSKWVIVTFERLKS